MRPELRNLDYHLYGLCEGDFDYVIALVRGAHDARIELTQQAIAPLRGDPDAVEIVDDQAYYAHVEATFLWEYAIWRLQGIFEGLISREFLDHNGRGVRAHGLQARLGEMRRLGYSLSPYEENELTAWADLRNALSHRPPEQFRPVGVVEEDVLEFRDLLLSIYRRWLTERGRSRPPDDQRKET